MKNRHFSPKKIRTPSHPSPPLGEREILSKLKNREEFEGGLKKRKNFKKPVIKIPKNREEFRQGKGEQFFWLARIYTPAPSA